MQRSDQVLFAGTSFGALSRPSVSRDEPALDADDLAARPSPNTLGIRRCPGNARGNLTLGRIDHEPRALVLGGQIVEPVNRDSSRRALERLDEPRLDGLVELRRRDVVHRPARPFIRALERRVRLVFSGEHPRDVRVAPRHLRRCPVLLDARGDEGLDRVRSGKAVGSRSGRCSLSPEHGGRHRDQADRGDERSTNSNQRGVKHPDLQESAFPPAHGMRVRTLSPGRVAVRSLLKNDSI